MTHSVKRTLPILDYLPMTVTVIIWSGTYIAGKFAVDEIAPSVLLMLRYAAAGIIMLPAMLFLEPEGCRLRPKDIGVLTVVSLTGMLGNNYFFFLALRHTTVTNASVIYAVTPLLIAILAAMFVGEKLDARRMGAIAVALAGVLLLLTGGNPAVLRDLSFNRGDLYELIASFCTAVYTVAARKVAYRYSPLVVTGYAMIISALFSLPLAAGSFSPKALLSVSALGWGSLAYLVVLASCMAYLLQQMSVKKIGANRTAAFINLSPPASMAMAALILGEKISLIQAVSALIIVTGVAQGARACEAVGKPSVSGHSQGEKA